MDKGSFLKEFDLDEMDFDKSELDYNELLRIYYNFKSSVGDFEQVATLLANTIQKNDHVHSVRWRVKDAKHLIKKIIRKAREEGKDEYKTISEENYRKIVTDLVGIRVLHLFKNEWALVCDFIDEKWKIKKEKTAYYKHGDSPDLIESYRKLGYTAKEHSSGYRSIHLVFGVNFFGDSTFVEIQVRTIFEEAWSEMDHELRYPDHSDDKTLIDMIATLNENATNADKQAERAREHKERIDLEKAEKAQNSLEKDVSEQEKPVSKIIEKDIRRTYDNELYKGSGNTINDAYLEWSADQERYKNNIEKLSMGALYPDSPYESIAKRVADQWTPLIGSDLENLSNYQESNISALIDKIYYGSDYGYDSDSDSVVSLTNRINSILSSSDPLSDLAATERLVNGTVSGFILNNSEILEGNINKLMEPSPLDTLLENQQKIKKLLRDQGFDSESDDES